MNCGPIMYNSFALKSVQVRNLLQWTSIEFYGTTRLDSGLIVDRSSVELRRASQWSYTGLFSFFFS